jgi:hypothetical protein
MASWPTTATGAEPIRRLAALWEPRAGFPTLRAVGWSLLALRRLRREIVASGLEVQVYPPPTLPSSATRGVEPALRLARATCLERSLIVQRWLLSQGRRHDVLVGVAGGSKSMEAHAWVDSYDPDDQGADYRVLTRVAPSE